MRTRWKQLLLVFAVLMPLAACVALSALLPSVRHTATAASDNPAALLAAASSLPVLSITTDTGALPDENDSAAMLRIYTVSHGMLYCETAHIEINERGNTSRRFPKKSYRIKIVDENGDQAHLSIAGLRIDDDWILNPMYTDTSKIREALAYSLWADINSSGTAAASSRLAYAEVYINGDYWGLYGVQERIDRKQVAADKRSGVLYKVVANDRPTIDELLACESADVCRAFELQHTGASVGDPWEPAAAYMALLEGGDAGVNARLSLENTIDYGLWAMLTQAHDCHFKNQYLHCAYTGNGYTMYKIPWDLNHTFGDVWHSEGEAENYTDYRIGSLVMDGAFAVLIESGQADVYSAIARRWHALRSTIITEESLIDRAHALYAPLSDALDRDSARWPTCGMGNGNARNIRDIEQFIRNILPRMDAYIASLGAE